MLPFTDTRAFSRSYVPGTGTARPCSVTSLASGPWSPGCTSSRTRIEPMLQNINCASPVAASTPTRTLGSSARTSWPCETFACSNRSRSLNDCDCAVMRASIRHLLLNVVVRAAASESSLTGGSREPGAGSSTQPCDWSGVLYTVGLVDAQRLMPIRPRLTRPPRILIASDQNHALSDVVRSLGRQGYSVLRVFAEASVLERARTAGPDVVVLDAALGDGESLDVSRALRADPSIGSGTPILLLVPTRPRREDHLTALRAGVWELVRQPLDVAGLLDKLDRYVLVKVERDGVSRRDLVDDVTGLYSTHGLARRAGELILQAARHNTSVACVAVAPDRNGQDGGGDGVEALRGVARLLEASGRRSDAIGRIGPAEFAVVAAGVNRSGARQLAKRLRDSVGIELRAGYDAVGSRRAGGGALEARSLLARAARALEMAKLEGKWVKEARD